VRERALLCRTMASESDRALCAGDASIQLASLAARLQIASKLIIRSVVRIFFNFCLFYVSLECAMYIEREVSDGFGIDLRMRRREHQKGGESERRRQRERQGICGNQRQERRKRTCSLSLRVACLEPLGSEVSSHLLDSV
jgi:hypothetical protein